MIDEVKLSYQNSLSKNRCRLSDVDFLSVVVDRDERFSKSDLVWESRLGWACVKRFRLIGGGVGGILRVKIR